MSIQPRNKSNNGVSLIVYNLDISQIMAFLMSKLDLSQIMAFSMSIT